MSSITTAQHGSEAIRALQRHLGEARENDPLAAATIVVQNSAHAVYVRKALAEQGGVAGVDIVPVAGFVRKLALRRLPLGIKGFVSPFQRRAAIQAQLIAQPGPLKAVATHPSTLERFSSLSATLRGLPSGVIDKMLEAATGLSLDALQIVRGATMRLGGYITASQELDAALEAIESGLDQPVVCFGIRPTNPISGRLLAALASLDQTLMVFGMTGVSSLDSQHRQSLSGWGVQVRSTSVDANPGLKLEVSDPEDEVQVAMRAILEQAASGVALSDMAILYPSADPYAGICFQLLEEAGLPASGPDHLTLVDSVPARALVRMLDLLATGLDRASVTSFLQCAPICGADGRPVPAVDWDQISRQAGVIEPDSWESRLTEYQRLVHTDSRPNRQAADSDVANDGSELLAFVVELESRLTAWSSLKTWAELSAAFDEALRYYLPVGSDWPLPQQRAYEDVVEVVAKLADLDGLLTNVNPEIARTMLVSELCERRLAARPYGSGLLVAHIDDVCGLAFEQVVVLGAAQGSFPRVGREDPLINDQLRAVAGHYLGPSAQSASNDAWSIAAALAGSKRPGIVTHSRGELRSGRSRTWPQVLSPLVAQDEVIESHFQGVLKQGRPVSSEDFAARELLVHTEANEPIGSHPLASSDKVLAAGLARLKAKDQPSLTAHTGLVPPKWLDLDSRPFSPTALETYASCPRRYLLGRVLRISEQERPEQVEEISARDRGSLLHKVLERFIAEALTEKSVPSPEQAWSDQHVERLFGIATEEVAVVQELGLSGGRVQTQISHRNLNAELTNFVRNDNELRANYRSTPSAVEFAFGFDETQTVFRLADGRELKIRGSVDRVDTTADGGLLVIDYKTGSSRSYTQIDANPFDEGRRLQLPMYGSVVADEYEASGATVAMYWMTRESKQITMELGAAVEHELDDTIGDLLSGISAGCFPGIPGDVVGYPRVTFENCTYCEFDQICPQDRQREWSNAQTDNESLLELVRGLPGV